MSDIGPIAPAEKQLPTEEHRPVERDGRKLPRRQRADDDMVDAEPHTLDVEA